MSKMSKKENDEARAKAYETLSANETPVMVCMADVKEATPEEERSHECGFRRGYQKGYMAALNDIWSQATLSRHRINLRISLKRYQELESYGNGKLRNWRQAGVFAANNNDPAYGTELPPERKDRLPKKPF